MSFENPTDHSENTGLYHKGGNNEENTSYDTIGNRNSDTTDTMKTGDDKTISSDMALSLSPSMVKVIWGLHFLVSCCILWLGSVGKTNQGQKYVSIDVKKLQEGYGTSCRKAYVNVFAESIDQPDALICCPTDDSMICDTAPVYLPLAGRLSKMPDAWLIPVVPLLIRFLYLFWKQMMQQSRTDYGNYAKNRFVLYVAIMFIRGWVLYLSFNKVEEVLFASSSSNCWYVDLLKSPSQRLKSSSCYGRDIDFSDHVVLYFAQILPLALTEVLYSFLEPYWHHAAAAATTTASSSTSIQQRLTQPKGTTSSESSSSATSSSSSPSSYVVPILLIIWMILLYTSTLYSAYKTSVFYHTGLETIAGYMISLIIQIPLCLLQCTLLFPSISQFFFGPTMISTAT